MRLTLRQLQYFVTIVEEGNITRAAERLHVAPTAVSLQVKAMEERLGVALLARHSRGVSPTPAGQELHGRARQILQLVQQAEHAAAGARAPRRIRAGAPPAVARVIGVEAILAAANLSERIALQITEGWAADLRARLIQGELDLVVGYGFEPAPDLEIVELVDERFLFVAAPGIARTGETIGLAEALAADLVFYGERSIGWRVAHAAARARGLAVNVRHEVESVAVWRDFLLRGLGAAITPFGAVAEEFRRGELAVMEIEGTPLTARLCLAARLGPGDGAIPPDLLALIADLVRGTYMRLGPYYRVLGRAAPRAEPVAAG